MTAEAMRLYVECRLALGDQPDARIRTLDLADRFAVEVRVRSRDRYAITRVDRVTLLGPRYGLEKVARAIRAAYLSPSTR